MSRFFILIVLVLGLTNCVYAQVEGKFGQGVEMGATFAGAQPNQVYAVIPMTVECFAKLGDKSALNILIANEPKNSVSHWEIFADKGSGQLCCYWPGFTPDVVRSKVDVVDGNWHYIAMVNDGGSIRLVVDGKEAANVKVEKRFGYPDVGLLSLGRVAGVDSRPTMLMDEVRISRVAREIKGVPSEPFVLDADTVGLWHFDGDGKKGWLDVSATKNAMSVRSTIAVQAVSEKNYWQEMDCGPFFSGTLGFVGEKNNVAAKGIAVRLGKNGRAPGVLFDTELLTVNGMWIDGQVKIYPDRDGLARHPDVEGKIMMTMPYGRQWAMGEKPGFDDPRADKLGTLPENMGRYRGLYQHGNRTIFSYTVGQAKVLETHDVEKFKGQIAITRTIEMDGVPEQTVLKLLENKDAKSAMVPRNDGLVPDMGFLQLGDKSSLMVGLVHSPGGMKITNPTHDEVRLQIDPTSKMTRFKLLYFRGDQASLKEFVELMDQSPRPMELEPLTHGGDKIWGEPIVTQGKSDADSNENGYALDTITAPEKNEFKSFLRFAGLDFLNNGDMAICSVSGDVWIVSGLDSKLEKIVWKRFATGLYQPLGLKVVDNTVYVLGRDQITKLIDVNGDGQADFYQCFNNDCKTTRDNGHAYATNLEIDPAGNFYFAKCSDATPFGGTVVKVSKDGKYAEPFANGLRNPNGLGVSPTGLITQADNQGDWVPASRLDVVEGGAFLGYKPMSKGLPAKELGKPLLLLPQNMDSSSGGQVWVTSDKFGPIKGDMLHTSYGSASLFHVMMEKVDGVWQGGATRFAMKFDSGAMRGRFHAQDGQLYVCGLRGWQTAAIKPGSVQRVRYTGKPVTMPVAMTTHQNGVKLRFDIRLDKQAATDAGNASVIRWTYKWTSDYPSRHFSIKDPKKQGFDEVDVKSLQLSEDGKSLFIEIPGIAPALNQEIKLNLKSIDGLPVNVDLYQTIHNLGPATRI